MYLNWNTLQIICKSHNSKASLGPYMPNEVVGMNIYTAYLATVSGAYGAIALWLW